MIDTRTEQRRVSFYTDMAMYEPQLDTVLVSCLQKDLYYVDFLVFIEFH